MNASSESLPPPPAYLLDSTGRTSPGKVGETVKALTELNHMPASPSVLRRNVSQMSPNSSQVNNSQDEQMYCNKANHPNNNKSIYLFPNSKFIHKKFLFFFFLHKNQFFGTNSGPIQMSLDNIHDIKSTITNTTAPSSDTKSKSTTQSILQ